jgi:hypothetical protein
VTRRPRSLRRALHALCVLAGVASAVLCIPALMLPRPAGVVSVLAFVILAAGAAGSVLAPRRNVPAPAAEGAQS